MITIVEKVINTSVAWEFARCPGDETTIRLWWLGQSGFAFRYRKLKLMIDPYLSDFLAQKYKGQKFPHIRMMQAPIKPEEVKDLDLVLCTHRHSDHMDPGTLPIIAANNPDCRFIIPGSQSDWAVRFGLPRERILPVNAGDYTILDSAVSVKVVASAHEEIKVNERGEHHFLGYILKCDDIVLYHSGDCVPYADLEKTLSNNSIDVAMLPINGRDTTRKNHNILGNFTFQEAVDVCSLLNIPAMIAHHYGMFDFNTVNIKYIENKMNRSSNKVKITFPKPNVTYSVSK